MIDNADSPSDETRIRIARLWMQAQSTVASFLAASIHNTSDVDDLLQEVAVKVAREFDRYDPSRPFVNWAIGIARYEMLTFLRDRGRQMVALDPGTIDYLADACVAMHDRVSDMHVALESCMAKLDVRGRHALQLRYYDGGSLEEVAKQLKLNPTAASALLYRLRSSLAKCIERALGKSEVSV